MGMADNHLMAFFAMAIVIGVLLSGGGRQLVSRWFWAGVAIAVACTVPDTWWQATHGWAAVAMTHALNTENGLLVAVGLGGVEVAVADGEGVGDRLLGLVGGIW